MRRFPLLLAAASLALLSACEKKAETKTPPSYDLSAASNSRFLAENGAKPDVHTTADGLQYRVIKSGSGKTPQTTDDIVTVNYKGWMINGKVFDQTKEGSPADFPAGGLIPGWVEALTMMKEGDGWELVIPSALGYGAQGAGADIPPNQTLVFDMTLISVKPAP